MRLFITIGIIGHTGMVGSTLFRYFKHQKYRVIGYSIDSKVGVKNHAFDEINKRADIIFICVPTPYNFKNERPNFKIVRGVVSKIDDGKIIVIKSTVYPGMTSALQKEYPKKKLLFNPEFLSRKTAYKDFISPDRQIIGYTPKSKNIAKDLAKILPKAPYQVIIKSEEAELIKYSHNIFGAMRIVFSNHLYDASEKLKVDYKEVIDGFVHSKFIGKGYLRYATIFSNGKRGYGGPCFPKDVNSYIYFCKQMGIPYEIIDGTRKANKRILESQKLTEEKAEDL